MSSTKKSASVNSEDRISIVRLACHLADRIVLEKPAEEKRMRFLKEKHPDLFALIMKLEPDEMFSILEDYRENIFFRKDLAVVLSPEGRKWVEENLPKLKAFGLK